jgi:pyruvate dehydrogenase E2 component (dihydrolipoamide acetyltransferase)
MAETIEVRVPDLGDFTDVPVIEVLVKPGDAVKANDSLITLESDKASMEVPSPAEGVVRDIKVSVGDKVSEGSVILSLASEAPQQRPSIPQGASMPQHDTEPQHDKAQTQQIVELRVPDIGDFKDVPVIEVLVKPGDAIAKDASIVTLESEKASMEVPASTGGTIRDVKVKVGDKVSQGDAIATVEGVVVAPSASMPQRPSIPQDDTSRAAATHPAPRQAIRAAPATQISGNGEVHASPSIRRFARELGVDLHRVAPSGPNGRVTREDVQNFVKHSLTNGVGAAPAGATLGLAPWPKVDFAQYGEIERKPLSRIQKISGPNLHRNWVMIPHVTQDEDADVTDLEEFRKQLNAELGKSGVKITMLAFLIKAAVAALKRFPAFNSSLDGDELVYKKYYHIGFAADTPGGLLVPVVRDADKKGITQLAQETAELAAKARDGKLPISDMQGGTFTISSLGSIGGTYFTPIINAPEVAILGACRAATRPVWNGSEFVPRLVQPLSLSYDHRVIDGAAAARFTAYLASVLSDLRRALI